MNDINPSVLDKLKEASSGLLFMSESEYPFEGLLWESKDAITTENILQRTGHSPDTPVEVVDIDSFFEPATTEQDWHGEEEKETTKKYQVLVETLKHNLSDIKVYRLGPRAIDVYIVGTTPSGEVTGLSTKVVET